MKTQTWILVATLLGFAMSAPAAAAGIDASKLKQPLPGVSVRWPGEAADGETVAVQRYLFTGGHLDEVDERCVGTFSAGFRLPPIESFQIPETIEDERVKGARISTDLNPGGGVACLYVKRMGVTVHRGLVGEWTTEGTFPPGTYVVYIGSPGNYRFTVEVELVSR